MLLFCLLGMAFGTPVFGQYPYQTLATPEGLSQGYVNDILQDRDGFMWFATKDGLNRYDGYHFRVYTHDTYDPNSISSNVVNYLYEDSKGRIWICTEDNGISIYNKSKDCFKTIRFDPAISGSLSGNKIVVPVVELPDGRFLVYATESDLNVVTLTDDFFESNTPPQISKIALNRKLIQYMYTDRQGKTWVLYDDDLYQFLPDQMRLEFRKPQVSYTQVFADNDGNFWANGNDYSAWDGAANYPIFTSNITNGHGTSFFIDDKQKLWVGITNKELLQIYDISNWNRNNPLDAAASKVFEEKGVTPMKIMKDRSGLLWLGTNGYGLRKYTFESEKFNHGAKGMSIRRIIPLQNGEFYIRSWGEVKKLNVKGQDITTEFDRLLFKEQDFFVTRDQSLWILHRKEVEPYIFDVNEIENYNPQTGQRRKFTTHLRVQYEQLEPMLEDRHGNIWVCGINGRFIVLNPGSGAVRELSIKTKDTDLTLQNAAVTALYEDAQGVVWMGTVEGFVKIVFNSAGDNQPVITWFKSDPANKNGLNFDHVSCFLDDPLDQNILLIATKGGGLNRYNKTTGQFTHITVNQGLCNNVVYGILPDENGHIWGSTNNGVFCLLSGKTGEKSTWEFRHFTGASGLQSSEFNTGAFVKMPDNRLAFGGVNGLNIFDPKAILIDTFSPNIFITRLLVGNKEVRPDDENDILDRAIQFTPAISLNHTQDIFTLEFAALDYRASDQNKYRYQMTGIDNDWIENGHSRIVSYSHLPPGTYTFKVQGSNSLGIWSNKTAELKITILPPWWRSWWALLAYLLAGAAVIRWIFKYRLQQNKIATQLQFEQNEAKRIKELDTAKTRLYTNITHEFRTPLTVILGMAQQAKNTTRENFENSLDMIVRNGKNMLNLVNELLDLSKMDAGKMELNLVQGDVIQFLRYIVESFHSMADSQDKQLHYLSSLDVFHTAYDPERMRQIISNLLSNALKFTQQKGNIYITISSQPVPGDDALQQLMIKVKDTGVGIPEGEILHIFDRFYQADNTHTRHAEGTGVGLALTKELVLLMKGSIEVKSPPVGARQGTEFTITLPMKQFAGLPDTNDLPFITEQHLPFAPVSDPAKTGVVLPPAQPSRPELILIVEDNSDVVAYTAGCISDYRLAVAKDGREGFELACDLIPDLIITDVMMPYMDGFEMTQRLRADERTSHIPIIMLTAKADIESKMEGIERGADAYLEKPFYKDELLLRIRKLMEQRQLLQKIYARLAGFQQSNGTSAIAETAPAPVEIPAKENEFVKKVRLAIEINLSDEYFGVDQLSKKVFLSQSQLHRKLTALTGHSPNQYIRLIRTQKAGELLRTTDKTLAQIASECGFSDASYFGKVFRQEMGVTPVEWRNGRTD